MVSKSVKALKNSSKYKIDCCICLVVTYLKMEYFGCKVDFSSNYSVNEIISLIQFSSNTTYLECKCE